MKSLLLLNTLLLLLLFSSCATYNSGYNTYKREGIVVKNNADLYEYKAGEIGDKVGNLSKKKGDTITLYGYIYRHPEDDVYSIIDKKDTVFVSKTDVMTLKNYAISLMPTTFSVPKDQDEIVWGRANKYVADNADLKIQTQTNFLIETFNPFKDGQKAFKITRQPKGETVEFEITATVGEYYYSYPESKVRSKYSLLGSKECAYFLKNGDE